MENEINDYHDSYPLCNFCDGSCLKLEICACGKLATGVTDDLTPVCEEHIPPILVKE